MAQPRRSVGEWAHAATIEMGAPVSAVSLPQPIVAAPSSLGTTSATLIRVPASRSAKFRQHLTSYAHSVWSAVALTFRSVEKTAERAQLARPIGPRGYPQLATFMDSNDGFMIYRRFGYLQSRLLLEKQEQLRQLEDELDELDRLQTQGEDDEDVLCTSDLDPDLKIPREQLMKEIESTFLEYGNLLQTARSLVAMQKPRTNEYRSAENYVDNEKPLVEGESAFIYYKEDLITLAGVRERRELNLLQEPIERFLRRCNFSLIEKIFSTSETGQKTNVTNKIHYSASRIQAFITAAIMLLLLVLPIYILFHLSQSLKATDVIGPSIAVLLAFTLAFFGVFYLLTTARVQEVITATAAYVAVLVVFIGNANASQGSA